VSREIDAEVSDTTIAASPLMSGGETLDVWDGGFPESQFEITIDGGTL
jgi:hypothetical protein